MLNNRPKWNDILTGATIAPARILTSSTNTPPPMEESASFEQEEQQQVFNQNSPNKHHFHYDENSRFSIKERKNDNENDIQLSFPFAPSAEPNSINSFSYNNDEENRLLMSKVIDSIPISLFHKSSNASLCRSSTPIGPPKSPYKGRTGVHDVTGSAAPFNMLHLKDDDTSDQVVLTQSSTPPSASSNKGSNSNLFSKTTSDLLEGLLAPGPTSRRKIVGSAADKHNNSCPSDDTESFEDSLNYTIGTFDALDIFSSVGSTTTTNPITASSTPDTPSNRQRGTSSFDYSSSGSTSRLGRRHSSLFGLAEWDSESDVGTLMSNDANYNSYLSSSTAFGKINQMPLQSSIAPPPPPPAAATQQQQQSSFNIDELLESSSQIVNTNGTISRSASLTGNSLILPIGRSNCSMSGGLGFNGVSSLNPLTNQNSPSNRRHSVTSNAAAPWVEAANAVAAAGVPMPSHGANLHHRGGSSESSSTSIKSFISQAFNPASAEFLPNSNSFEPTASTTLLSNDDSFDFEDEESLSFSLSSASSTNTTNATASSSYVSSVPLPPLTSQYSQGDLALSVKSQWKMSTAKGSLYALEFKAGRTEIFYVLEDEDGKATIPSVKLGDLCIVEADRGEDLGRVTVEIPMAKLRSLLSSGGNNTKSLETSPDSDILTHELASLIQAREIIPKRIHRLTHDSELRPHLTHKSQEEAIAMVRCQARIRQKKLPMEVVDAEYQWDRNKLTFYFSADRRIDFRELVRDLFRIYKTRIWMCAVDKNAGSRMVLYNSASTGGPAFLTTPALAPSSKF